MGGTAGLGVFAAVVLTTVALYALHAHQGSFNGGMQEGTQFDSIGNVQRKLWHDSMDPRSHRDQAIPKHLRGDRSERVHYMDTIAPRDDTQWFSACIASPDVHHHSTTTHTTGGAEKILLTNEEEDHELIEAAKMHERSAARRLELQRESAAAKDKASRRARAKKEAMFAQGAETTSSLPFTRDEQFKHAYSMPQPPLDDKSPWLNPQNPFGFKRKPHRNPALACLYSPQYRSDNPDECADNIPQIPEDMGTMKSPFKSISFVLKPGKDTTCAAWGWFSNDLLTSGWNYLYVESNPTLTDEAQARAAGYLEGALTVQPIFEHHQNEFQVLFPPSGVIDNLTKGFLNDMTTFNLQMVAQSGATDPYWQQMGLIYQQLQGVYEGYLDANTDPSKAISYFDLLCLQYDGDMADIQATVGAATRVSTDDSLQTIMDYLIRNGHCSALIKVTEGNQELWAAHDTWAGFSSTHRMFKAYRLPLGNVSSTAVHFSSYPAFLSSTDDWYQTYESQLTILETTNDIVNQSLYNLVDSSTVATWGRAIIASRLATGGNDWCGFFGYYQSGTYNNQWMVVDYSVFNSGTLPGANTLWILEVMPGSVFSADVSYILAGQGYWASYNRPWFEIVYTEMGYAQLNVTYGPYLFGYSRYFRGEIFAREQPSISSLLDMQRVMSLNKWQTDPWSHNNSGFAISSRFDLSTYDPVPSLGFFYRGAWGAYDVKITNSLWNGGLSAAGNNQSLRVSTHSGPTSWDQPVFTWADPEWTNYSSHIGLPESYDFDFVQLHL